MTKIAICGAAGRMGTRLIALAEEDDGLSVVGAIEQVGNTAVGRKIAEGVAIIDSMESGFTDADVALAFVNDPQATIAQAEACAASSTAFVVGTTGLSSQQQHNFESAISSLPCVQAANFSVGVNVLLGLVNQAASIMAEGFDVEIVEAHHTQKKDAPSGTALALGQAAADGLGWSLEETQIHGRQGIVGDRPSKQIAFHALRAGDIVGTHTVLFGGAGETVELTHRAQSRDTFAAGALRAAKWVSQQPPGLYGMRDVLGLA